MVKVLRSLIQEKFPVDLRVKIELLSKRRDIINKEKRDELFKILREYEIENIVPLGPGTNRYAFKLDGFVIKVATDQDGKIDNMKEFKMAKRLYPYVTKTYEVSENGTLLVAEYIQPFSSYGEMLQYANKIREILTKLSSVYLIGDVGVTSKNYANWGLRIGHDDPVCLDFAYVYDVSSELFICSKCKSGTILVPNKDFTELICTHPGCGGKFQFEDIRSKIGNDLHRHEIGDLSDEGYLLSESFVTTELTPTRSNYLMRQQKQLPKKVVKEKEEVILDNFVMPDEPSNYYGSNFNSNNKQEVSNMLNQEKLKNAAKDVASRGGIVIKARARVIRNKTPKPAAVHEENIPNQQEPIVVAEVEPEEESGLAFSGSMNANDVTQTEQITSIPQQNPVQQEELVLEDPLKDAVIPSDIPKDVEPEPVKPEPKVAPAQPVKVAAKVTVKSDLPLQKSEPKPAPVQQPVKKEEPKAQPQQRNDRVDQFSEHFLSHIKTSFSIITNKVGSELHIRQVFDDVKPHIRAKKVFGESFYKAVQNAVFRSLMQFCNFTESDVPNQKGKGFHKEFTPPEKIEGELYTPTFIFLNRIWNDKSLNQIEDPAEMLRQYRIKYDDYLGFQPEWLDFLRNRLKIKNTLNMDQAGIEKVVQAVAEVWVMVDKNNSEEPEPISPAPAPVTPPAVEHAEVKQSPQQVQPEAEVHEEELPNIEGSYSMEDGEATESEEFDSEGNYNDENVDTPQYLSVDIYRDEEIDVIKVRSGEAFGEVVIPFYTKLDEVDETQNVPSLADERNGKWDWLIHMVPDLMFETTNPDEWLEINNCPVDQDQSHIVILHEEKGVYTMGIYYLLGIWNNDEDGNYRIVDDDATLMKINKIIREDIGYTRISHLNRTLSMTELIMPEEEVRRSVMVVDYDVDGEGEENMNENETVETTEDGEGVVENAEDLEAAAIAALTGNDNGNDAYDPEAEEFGSAPVEVEAPVQQPVKKEEPKAQPQQQVFTPMRRKH